MSLQVKSVHIAYCRVLQSLIYKNAPERNFISFSLQAEITDGRQNN